ncbi:MAG TPA: TonB-dependent receptor [Sphingomicrobium sp.]|nr:TonB-dependent receptor [Sphingomicrobium sp.]
MRVPGLSASVALLALAVPQALAAQATTPGDQPAPAPAQGARTTSYDAAFFARYAPRTALDIALRVPGFTLDLGNSDTRGFAGAAGNVVINGARPSSKAESLETTLARIPASSVVKVEVGPGDLYGAEYSGKSQVLNVMLSAVGGFEGNVTLAARRIYTGHVTPTGSASAMIRRGSSTVNLSAGTEHVFQYEEGTDTLADLATGAPVEHRRKINHYRDFNPYVSGSWALEHSRDRAVRINARFSPGRFDLEQRNRVTPVGGPQRDDSLIQDYDSRLFELGGDVTRPLAGGAIKLVGLATRRKRDNFDTYLERDGLLDEGAVVVGGFEQTQEATRNETIGRLNWTRQDLAGFSFETGGEAVLNTLDSAVDLFVFDETGERVRIDLPIDHARVKEKRAEAFVNVGRSLTPALRLDAGLTFEHSRLSVRGDTTADRTLSFWKPKATLDWKPGAGWHTQLSVSRTVAQLDFFDFISAAELSTDRVNAGNANLLPQRAWEVRFTADHPILGDGLVKLDLGHDRISRLQDRVLVFDESGRGFDAPGNIGTGKRSFARLNVDAPLGRLWTGLRVKANAMVQRTRVEDPVSGETRNFSGFYPDWEWYAEARRDSGPLSYGLAISDRDRFAFFRTDEFDVNYNGGPYATAFVEYRPDARTAITLDVDNVLDTNANRERRLFFPNRADTQMSLREVRERNRHLNFGLTVKRSFGGGGVAKSDGGG